MFWETLVRVLRAIVLNWYKGLKLRDSLVP